MNKARKPLFWLIWYSLALVSLIIAFPIILFTLYPYSIIAVAVYIAAIIVLSILYFRNSKNASTIIKRVLLGLLLVPIIALLTILLSIKIGWFHFPVN